MTILPQKYKNQVRAAHIGATGTSFESVLWLISISLHKQHQKTKCSPINPEGILTYQK